jgi:hypothetical protein
MENLLDAVRGYFEQKNRVWISGNLKDVIRAAKAKPDAEWWEPIGASVYAKRRAYRLRHSRLLRTHTKVKVRSLERNSSGDAASLIADEWVTWVYNDVDDYNVEARIIHHTQQWRRQDGQWRLQKDTETSEKQHGHLVKDVIAKHASEHPRHSEIHLYRGNCTSYDRLRALRYAEVWWNGYNGAYNRFSDDCTNFISQCLFAGNLRMTGAPNRAKGWWYKFGGSGGQANWSYSWSTSHALYQYLINNVRAKLVSAKELKIGDVIFYDWEGSGRYHHSTVVVDFDGKGDPLVNAHTDSSYHRHYLYLDSRAWTQNTKYAFVHIPDRIC